MEIECLAEIRITELLPHPSCVVSIQLTQLNYHTDMAEFCDGLDSLLLGLALPDAKVHSPNENFPIDNFEAGIRLNRHLLEEIAKGT